jgi:hypothetical protein
MAQAGYTPISLYYSTTASTAPTSGNLVNGELAINITDGKLYYKDNGGTVQIIASKAGASGDVVGPASATDNAIVRFDGTTGKLVQNSVVTIADSTGDISGVGQLNATTVDATNIEVTNIKAKDGTAAASIADSTGIVTVTAAPVMSALTASQAVFTTAGKALTSNAITGTGNVVMSASPTLTGTISAAAATLSSDLTLSGGTANGVAYLNGSKVLTTGSALTFDGALLTQTVSDAVTSNKWAAATGKLRLRPYVDSTIGALYESINAAESAYLPLSFYASNIRFQADSNIISSVGGSEQMRLTTTGLGIGTSSPSLKLNIVGADAARFENTSNGSVNVYWKNSTQQYSYRLDPNNNGSRDFSIYDDTNSQFVDKYFQGASGYRAFYTNGSERMRLDSSGNFGLGGSATRATTVGTAVLNIFNGTAPVGTLTNGISLYSSSGEAYVMDAAGNATLFSPHDAETNEWVFKSKHTPTGKVLKIDVEKLLRFVNDHFGLDAVHEFVER